MRLLTWNINGIRTVPQYHPWNTLNSFDDILNYLEADIINFQEVKQARNALPKPVALPASYDSFFSFPIHKNGYSGVATYTRADSVVPLKAEEGITGLLHASPAVEGQPSRRNAPSIKKPKLVLNREERVSSSDSSYPGLSPGLNSNNNDDDSDDDEVELGPSGSKSKSLVGFGFTSETDLKALDSEGRTLVLDFGLFVLVNVYCPNDGSADEADSNNRIQFKTDFHNVLEARIRSLLKEGREVILVGDLNACATINDHCEGDILMKRVMRERESMMMDVDSNVNPEEIFWEEKQSRRWLRDLIQGDEKCFVDVTRMYHPNARGCWNTKISARESNYGTRIDYILVTPNLLPWVKFSDIQPQIKGSDHCPVFVDFHDEREIDGKIVKLRDLLAPCVNANNVDAGNADIATPPPTTSKRDPPRLAARFWDEYSGKQRLLDSFFKGGSSKKNSVKEESSTTIAVVKSSAGPTSSVGSASSQVTSDASVIDPSPASSQKSNDETMSLKRPRSLSSNLEINLEAATSASTQNKKVKKDDSFVSSIATTSGSGSATPRASSISRKPSGKEREEDKKTKKLKSGQAKLSSFFTAPSSSQGQGQGKGKGKQKNTTNSVKNMKTKGKPKVNAEEEEVSEIDLTRDDYDMGTDADTTSSLMIEPSTDPPSDVPDVEKENQEESDYRLALSLSQESISSTTTTGSSSSQTIKSSKPTNNAASGAAWKTLLAKPPAPRCTVHNEEAREFRVNKPGPNKGKAFWVCSRPVGPGYDRGRNERPREEVDPKWKCNFFMWGSDLKKESTAKR
ncbi:DNase I-like protein [Dendrothele bispora CBS 962.96]|uniref:DNA-(apurinic or apyrimidinic site) endonuclease 2 n=1 Tax=Dendrothele bispora (strain CBS 962.96) TaxID=1314807 RepID=A0A4S8MM59_DENBC|nr:DNase I-like protein [Dendrothele bispora CBS 962.96]